MSVEELLESALGLSVDDRAMLAHGLLRSLDPPEVPLGPEEWERAWSSELDRRLEAVERGDFNATEWKESINRVRRELNEKASS